MFIGTPLAAQQTRTLEPIIAELLRPATRNDVLRRAVVDPMASPETQPLGGMLALERRGAFEEPALGVFVRTRAGVALDEIRARGGVIGSVQGNIVTARVPIGALDALAQSPNIVRIEAARALRFENDSAARAIGVDELRTVVNGEWQGAIGEGAIVGIYDTGLDFRHDDFRDTQGATRVLGLWDQTRSGTPPTGFSSGNYCTPVLIQEAIDTGTTGCSQRDSHGHGTHVAGSAAGDGSAGSPATGPFTYAGVAPGADLLIVNGGPGVFFENMIIDGLAWLRQEGLRLGRPIVVNLSLGGQVGAHDGSRLYEQLIDALSGPGFIVVVSAGNSGVNGNTTPPLGGPLIHARGVPVNTDTREFELVIAPYSPSNNTCTGTTMSISLWYEAADQLTIAVVRPDGTSAGAARGIITTDESTAGRIRIDNGSGGTDPENGDVEVLVTLNGCGTSGPPAEGSWKLRVTPVVTGSQLPYDMWIFSSVGVPFTGGAGFDNRMVVGSPGTAERAITVGAFVTRLCWPSVSTTSQICYTQREQIGDIARFSSGGPSRDGRTKPEIMAPGLGVMSSHSSDALISNQRVAPDQQHAAREGTSMAAPQVTGAIAVLLAQNPQLTPEDVRAILAGSATRDAFTSTTYSATTGAQPGDWWGFGKLNVRDALLALSDGSAATLAFAAEPASPAAEFVGAKGARLPLMQLTLEARGFEAIEVTSIGFDVSGNDPGAKLLLLRDDGNGRADPSDAVAGTATVALTPASRRVVITPGEMSVPPFAPTTFFLAVELSGRAPNGSVFEATLVPQELHSVGTRTGASDQFEGTIIAVASGPASTTVLENDARLSFSENPVRDGDIIFNFANAPTTAAIYTVNGRRVTDLCRDAALVCGGGGGQAFTRWELRNDAGERVAPGVYLVIFQVAGTMFREKLMVLTPATSPDEVESPR